MAALYIHFPFCESRCIYCDFYSTTGQKHLHEDYINAVLEEIALRQNFLNDHTIRTIYLGGGTPSTLSPTLLKKLLHNLPLRAPRLDFITCETTMECNPDDVTPCMADAIVSAGINRVSIGIQTFSDKRLHFLHRRHTAEQAKEAVRILKTAGIKNISIDLMFGFPQETLSDWKHDIEEALRLEVNHISAYSLMYEEGTILYNMLEKGKVSICDEELSRDMYFTLRNMLCSAGYTHYEISNFCLPGYQSLHNSCYWDGTEYIGLGASAHSYNTTVRQWNVSSLTDYIQSINSHNSLIEQEYIDADTRYNDLITTALRTAKGLDLNMLSERHRTYLLHNAEKNVNSGFLSLTNEYIRLTPKALYISDAIMSDLIILNE